MTLQEVKSAIDTRLTELSDYIVAKQAECLAGHGVYFQALPTHSILPEDGEVLAADNLGAQPTDQPFGWNDVGGYPLNEPVCSTRVDTYNGPQGMGFVVGLSFKYEGVVWTKHANFGPETWREQDWHG